MKIRLFIVFVFLSIVFQLPSKSICLESVSSNTDSYVEGIYMPFHKIPGLALAIVKDNGVTLNISKGYGLRDFENGLPADGYTRFSIGSITKTFSAVIVVKTLSEEFPILSKFGLDVPIRELLPAFNFTLSDRFRSESTTFRDLLSHKTCLAPSRLAWIFGPYKTKQEFTYRQRYAQESCAFRTNLVYNNEMVALAAEIIAYMKNSTFENMAQSLFRELEMWSTTTITESEDYNTFPNMSRGYFLNKDGQVKRHNPVLINRPFIETGAGGILSTANDMKKYMMFHLNKGRVGNRQIVSQEAMGLLSESSNSLKAGAGKLSVNAPYDLIHSYGLGLVNSIQDGWEKISHGGYIPPYFSWMSIWPDLNLAIFVVSNGPGFFLAGHDLLTRQIYNFITNGTPYNTTELLTAANISSTTAKVISTPSEDNNVCIRAQDIVGLYGNALEGELVISATTFTNSTHGDDGVSITMGEWGMGNLLRQSNSTFRIQWTTDINQDFLTYIGFHIPDSLIMFSGSGNETTATLLLFAQRPGIIFKKDLTLEKLPAQPWESGSCGPMPAF